MPEGLDWAKADQARSMGAHWVIDSRSNEQLAQAAGRFDFILSTVNADLDWSAHLGAPAPKGRLHVAGVVPPPPPIPAFPLIAGRARYRIVLRNDL
ncbi:MAG: zinc-binding dehydrogenase [Bryobacteraceae bacterium]